MLARVLVHKRIPDLKMQTQSKRAYLLVQDRRDKCRPEVGKNDQSRVRMSDGEPATLKSVNNEMCSGILTKPMLRSRISVADKTV